MRPDTAPLYVPAEVVSVTRQLNEDDQTVEIVQAAVRIAPNMPLVVASVVLEIRDPALQGSYDAGDKLIVTVAASG